MKNAVCLLLFFTSVISTANAQTLVGAWQVKNGTAEKVLLMQNNYFTVTEFDKLHRQFTATWGGRFKVLKNKIEAVIEFNSAGKDEVGKTKIFTLTAKPDILITDIVKNETRWSKITETNCVLNGLWVITAREQNGKMDSIVPGDRKTIKILSGTRFQWIAINTATGDFFGTGGGTYSFENGLYDERIEFYSRDSTRAGKTLSFRGYVKDDKWDHSGRSSKGDPVHEIWTRVP